MNPDRVIKHLIYSVYGLATIIILMDLAYIFGVEIAFTTSRVTVYSKDIFTFTGSMLYDHILLLCLLFSSIMIILLKTKQRTSLTLLPLLVCIIYSISINNYVFSLLLYLFAIILIYFLYLKNPIEFMYSILCGLAVLEIQKIIYLLLRILGFTVMKINSPIYANIVLWYLGWGLNYIFIFTAFIIAVSIIISKVKPFNIKTSLFKFLKNIYSFCSNENVTNKPDTRKYKDNTLFVALGLLICSIVVLIPYFPSINPNQYPINTDWIYYYKWLNQLIYGNFNVFYLHSDRPLFLAILYIVWYITKLDPKIIAIYHNIPLLILYSYSIYFLASKWFNKETAKYALLLTPFSPIFLTFIYGGFQANLLAISLTYISLPYITNNDTKKFLIGILLYALTMFVHEWTWLQYFIIFSIYVIIRLFKQKYRGIEIGCHIKYFSLFLIIEFILFLSKHALIDRAIINENVIKNASLSGSFISSINWFFVVYTGGTLNNPLYYFLSIFGICDKIMSLFGLSIILSYMLAIFPWNILTYRIFLNTPINVLAGEGLRKLKPTHRFLFMISIVGIGLWKLLSIIPNFSP